MGKGVLQAVKNVNEVLGPLLAGMDPTKQQEIDDVRKVRALLIRSILAHERGAEFGNSHND